MSETVAPWASLGVGALGAATLAAATLTAARITLAPPAWAVRLAQRLNPDLVYFARTSERRVALTFDDGPDDEVTPAVLEILARHDVRATWFVIGERVERHRAMFESLLRHGHEVGNHFWSESPALLLDRLRFRESLLRTARAMGDHAASGLMRPASGWLRPWGAREARALGLRVVLGSVYCSDWLPLPDALVRRTMIRGAHPGAILVLHVGPGRRHTPRVLPDVLAGIRARGFEFVTVGELLGSAAGQTQSHSS